MKTISTTLFAILAVSVNAIAQENSFAERFRAAFVQSISGLDAIKGVSNAGQWQSTIAFPEFAESKIVMDETLGVLALRLSFTVMDEEAGTESMPRMEALVAGALPMAEYTKKKTYGGENYVGYMKTVYEFNSEKMADKEKRPSVEIGIIKTGDKIEVVILLYEPFFKNQYQPKF